MYSAQLFGFEIKGISGGEYLVLCPFHHDQHASAWYSESKGLFYCAVCGLGLNAYQLAKRMGVDVGEVYEEHRHTLPDFDLMDEHQSLDFGEPFYHPYFQERGISEAIANRYSLRWKMSTPQAAVLPVPNCQGETAGVVYRYLDTEEAGTRYRKLGDISVVWPLHLLQSNHQRIILTEGAFSAMRLATWLEGRESNLLCLSLLGAKATEEIANFMRLFPGAVVLYDNDMAGRRAARRLRELRPSANVFTVPTSPDDMSDKQIKKLITSIQRKFRW